MESAEPGWLSPVEHATLDRGVSSGTMLGLALTLKKRKKKKEV